MTEKQEKSPLCEVCGKAPAEGQVTVTIVRIDGETRLTKSVEGIFESPWVCDKCADKVRAFVASNPKVLVPCDDVKTERQT